MAYEENSTEKKRKITPLSRLIIFAITVILTLLTIPPDTCMYFLSKYIHKDEKEILLPKLLGLNQIGKNHDEDEFEAAPKTGMPQKMTYVFVLDTSLSIKGGGSTPPWFDEAVSKINKEMTSLEDLYDGTDKRIFNICKVRLAKSHLEIMNQDVNFATWCIGDIAEKIYPPKGKMKIEASPEHLRNAMIEMNKKKENNSLNTNIKNLFEKLLLHYSLKGTSPGDYKSPSVFLIMTSDLIHDVKNKMIDEMILERLDDELRMRYLKNKTFKAEQRKKYLENSEFLIQLKQKYENNYEDLKKIIQDLAKANILAKLIALGKIELTKAEEEKAKKEYKAPIWSLLKADNKFPDSHLKKYSIIGSNKDLIFQYPKAENAITLFFSVSKKIPEMSFDLIVHKSGPYIVGLDSEKNYYPTSEKKLNCKVIYKGKDSCIYNKTNTERCLIAGGIFHQMPAQMYERIQLTYKGEIPAHRSLPDFLIMLPEEKKIWSVPIQLREKPVRLLLEGFPYLIYFLIGVAICWIISLISNSFHSDNLKTDIVFKKPLRKLKSMGFKIFSRVRRE